MSVIEKHDTPAIPKDLFFLDANGNMTRIAFDDLKSQIVASVPAELPAFPSAAGNYTLKITVDSTGAVIKTWVATT